MAIDLAVPPIQRVKQQTIDWQRVLILTGRYLILSAIAFFFIIPFVWS